MQRAILKAKTTAEKYRDENTDAGARHIFREFIPASSLNQNGFRFEYEEPLQGKRPDWLDATAGLMMESYTYERGGASRFLRRVDSAIKAKCGGKVQFLEHQETAKRGLAAAAGAGRLRNNNSSSVVRETLVR